nr:hypothetical protein Q903MT_gene3370 [Picea sitchensis]
MDRPAYPSDRGGKGVAAGPSHLGEINPSFVQGFIRGSGCFSFSLVYRLKSPIEPLWGLTERRDLIGKIPALLNSKLEFLVRTQASSFLFIFLSSIAAHGIDIDIARPSFLN